MPKCKMCKDEIRFTGKYWEHVNTSPRHPAVPLEEPEPVLCYVDGNFAYFTTRRLADQEGRGWSYAPHEENAEPPRTHDYYAKEERVAPYRIVKVGFNRFHTPFVILKHYSVNDINNGVIPWLILPTMTNTINIYAGTTLSEFKKIVKNNGGEIYIKED